MRYNNIKNQGLSLLRDKSKYPCKSFPVLWAQKSLFLLSLFFENTCTGTYKIPIKFKCLTL